MKSARCEWNWIKLKLLKAKYNVVEYNLWIELEYVLHASTTSQYPATIYRNG